MALVRLKNFFNIDKLFFSCYVRIAQVGKAIAEHIKFYVLGGKSEHLFERKIVFQKRSG